MTPRQIARATGRSRQWLEKRECEVCKRNAMWACMSGCAVCDPVMRLMSPQRRLALVENFVRAQGSGR